MQLVFLVKGVKTQESKILIILSTQSVQSNIYISISFCLLSLKYLVESWVKTKHKGKMVSYESRLIVQRSKETRKHWLTIYKDRVLAKGSHSKLIDGIAVFDLAMQH